LLHEQGHFDITEVYARKLHAALHEYKFNSKTFKKDISDIYNNIVMQKEAVQQAYDDETSHSRNRRRQQQWLGKIANLLNVFH
jgi:predicted secreted Zn-dependent protease